MSGLSKALRKYQQNYTALTESGVRLFTETFKQRATQTHNTAYQQALVIPCFNESIDFIQRLKALPCTTPTLAIIVANCPGYASHPAQQQTQLFIRQCQTQFGEENVSEGVTFGQLNSGLDLLLLDITKQPGNWLTPIQSGVGFARKVGMDVAVSLWACGALSKPLMYSSDADAFWPTEYFDFDKRGLKDKGALVFAHQHISEQSDFSESGKTTSLSKAAALYDLSLRYYVLGLRWSGSPWAYHTIGSTLLIHGNSYVATRGFPIREAGEDFYLLNKIAKTATITSLKHPLLTISDRCSDRVPFGTGPAVSRIQKQDNPEREFKLYHPGVFSALKTWHQQIPQLHALSEDRLQDTIVDTQLYQGLQHLGFAKVFKHCQQQTKTPAQFTHQLWQWFDGFKTLKLVHWLREHSYPSVTYEQWKKCLFNQNIPFITGTVLTEDITPVELSRHLQQLEFKTLPYQGGLQ